MRVRPPDSDDTVIGPGNFRRRFGGAAPRRAATKASARSKRAAQSGALPSLSRSAMPSAPSTSSSTTMLSVSSLIGRPKKRRAPSGVKLICTQQAAPKDSIITGPANRPAAKLAKRSLSPGLLAEADGEGFGEADHQRHGQRGVFDVAKMAGRGFAIAANVGDRILQAAGPARAAPSRTGRRPGGPVDRGAPSRRAWPSFRSEEPNRPCIQSKSARLLAGRFELPK